MKDNVFRFFHIKSLRTYITIIVTCIIAAALVVSAFSFYHQTSNILQENYKEQMLLQLDTTIEKVNEQVSLIDYLYSLYMSNTLIYNAVELSVDSHESLSSVERQMTYLLINNYLWKEQFVDSVYIFTDLGDTLQVSTMYSHLGEERNRIIFDTTDPDIPGLSLRILDGDEDSLYFVRNIFSSNTGKHIATMIISINKEVWIHYLSNNIDSEWFLYLYNQDYPFISTSAVSDRLSHTSSEIPAFVQNSFSEVNIAGENYLAISEKLDTLDLYSVVVAPKSQIQDYMDNALQSYLLVMIGTILLVIFCSFAISRVIIYPIGKMIHHINRIASGHYEEPIPDMQMYEEFQAFTNAFNHMLEEINAYHADHLEKQLLLKSAEIQKLQSQINPHFLFNTLNTLAWKAQMAENPELYQMTISLGELLKSNVLSKESAYNSIDDEVKYIKFYVYLQKMRFEDKISVEFEEDEGLGQVQVPCFCIQTLVENAFVHGLEAKRGNGTLVISIKKEKDYVFISVIDDGVGFECIPDLQEISSSKEDSHTHVGLKNLDRRLFLLYGEHSKLLIQSQPNIRTSVSFYVPIQ